MPGKPSRGLADVVAAIREFADRLQIEIESKAQHAA